LRCLIFLIFIVWAHSSCAQTINNYKHKFVNQVEYGINFMHLYNNFNDNYDATGDLLRYKSTILWNTNFFLGYKFIIKNKHIIKLSSSVFQATITSLKNNSNDYKISFSSNFYSLGYGYKLPIKKVTLAIFGLLNYRKETGEGALVNYYQGQLLSEGTYAFLDYNSLWGFGTGFELEYFFSKNIGIGLNSFLNVFPNENASFYLDQLNGYKASNEFNSRNLPNSYFINSTMKLIYKFKLPSLYSKSNK